ncbi:MAG: hypothetical protein M3P92_03675, partial [Actinomycetota bacterium]|nr:hypothetical protein [Actinomycetota bacterium]
MGTNVGPRRSILGRDEVGRDRLHDDVQAALAQEPRQDLIHAERAGFDFSVTSGHFHLWLEEQGHSGYT